MLVRYPAESVAGLMNVLGIFHKFEDAQIYLKSFVGWSWYSPLLRIDWPQFGRYITHDHPFVKVSNQARSVANYSMMSSVLNFIAFAML